MNPTRARAVVAGLAALFAASALAGCLAAEATGTITVCVQDQVTEEFSSVFVTFARAEIKPAGAPDEDNDTEPQETMATETTNATVTAGNQTNETDGTTESPFSPTGLIGPCVQASGIASGNDTANTTGPAVTTSSATASPTDMTTTANATPETNTTTEETAAGGGQRAPRGDDGTGTETVGGHGAWITIVGERRTVDLMAFSGGLRALLGRADVPEGGYDGLRLQIEAAWGVAAATGELVEFKVPSGELRINEPFVVEKDLETTIVVDFQLDRSIVQAGVSGQWIFKPVVQVVVEEASEASPTATPPTTTGTVAGETQRTAATSEAANTPTGGTSTPTTAATATNGTPESPTPTY